MAQRRSLRDPGGVMRFRRTAVWIVIGLLVFTLIATLVFEGA